MIKVSTLCLSMFLVCCIATESLAQQDKPAKRSVSDQLNLVTSNLRSKQTFELRYRFAKGEEIRWSMEHVGTTETSMQGHSETSAHRTQATRIWKVKSIDTLGRITFDVIDEKIKMWKKVGDTEPKTFDSQSKEKPDADFADYAQSVGEPIFTLSIDPYGQIIKKKFHVKVFNVGAGELVKLPNEPVRIGAKWYSEGMLTPKYSDGRYKQVRIRYRYELLDVQDNIAIIGFKTQVLTPIDSPEIMSKIVRHISNGSMTFDMAAGRLRSKKLECNQKVQGFQGGDSSMTYLYQLTEKLQKPTKLASIRSAKPITIKTRDGGPVMRR